MFLNVDCACCDSVFACVLKRGTFFYSNNVRVRQHVDEREIATPNIIAAASLIHKRETRYLKLNISLTMHCFNTRNRKGYLKNQTYQSLRM
jgi:hypothetical protein